jgi:hypothetical protein
VGNQFVFRKGVATKIAIFKLTNEILNALKNKTMAGSIFCDLEKLLALLIMIYMYYCLNYLMELEASPNYYSNLIIRTDIKDFKSSTHI